MHAISVGGTKEQARLLAETRPPEAVDRLLALWRNAHRDIRKAAAASLVTFLGEGPRVSTMVSEALACDEPEIRWVVHTRPAIRLTPNQSVLLARLIVAALHLGTPDVVGAYGPCWHLAPEGLDAVVDLIAEPHEPSLAAAIVSVLRAAENTDAGDRALVAAVDRAAGRPRWLSDFRSLATTRRPEAVLRRLVEAFRSAGLPRLATEVVTTLAVRTLDVKWWRELVGDRPDRLSSRRVWLPNRWDEAAAVEILEQLAGIGGYVPMRLSLMLVSIAGGETKWARPWRDRLAALQAHDDVDIRELATAVRIP